MGWGDGRGELCPAPSGRACRPSAEPHAAALSPTGRLLAYADEKTVRVWDVAAGKEAVTIELPNDPNGLDVVSVTGFSADEKVLATADVNGTVRLWDTENGKEKLAIIAAPVGRVPGLRLLQALEF